MSDSDRPETDKMVVSSKARWREGGAGGDSTGDVVLPGFSRLHVTKYYTNMLAQRDSRTLL